MTRGFGSPTEWAYPGSSLTSSFFVFLPICVNLPQFVPVIVTNWSQNFGIKKKEQPTNSANFVNQKNYYSPVA
ncbi:MAG: hypothetical protein HWN67_23430 [Candidatus Helarchaeota archaeon]|nr:hypothetical protein [Candidatus Helarchaeota archaeon]